MTAPPTDRRLNQPIVDDGIRWLNFFNGRLLSAEDLRTDQDAILRSRSQLGRAIGTGVVSGFTVAENQPRSIERPVLSVDPGLAIDGSGQALELGRRITIGLVRVDASTDETGAAFRQCDIVLPGTAGLGAYVLTVGLARADVGKAAVAGLGNQAASCSTAYSAEGVRFRLFPVKTSDDERNDADRLRNRLAYRMFGVADPRRLAYAADPFSVSDGDYGDLDDLRATCFEGDVPLATLFWNPGAGISFADLWSVRRRPVARPPSVGHATPLSDRALAEGEAMVLQFESQLTDLLLSEGTPSAIRAKDRFRYLPPIGVVPLMLASGKGFDCKTFFDGITHRQPVFFEGAHLGSLLREAILYQPIDLDREEAIWLYYIRENAQRAGVVAESESTASAVVFTTGHLRYRGDARFDLAYWNYANYAAIG